MATMTEEQRREANLINLEEIEIEEPIWLWKPYIPLGKLTILQGDPGAGKTFLAAQIAAITSRGDAFPYNSGGDNLLRGKILFQSAEDGMSDTIKRRLVDANAKCVNIYYLDESEGSLCFDDDKFRRAFHLMQPKLIIIDPL